MKKTFIAAIICVLIIAIIFLDAYLSQPPFHSLSEYYSSVDYSCSSGVDCQVKDVGGCCGYLPRCTNENARTNPEFARDFCLRMPINVKCEALVEIDECRCIDGKCASFFMGKISA